MLMYVVVQFVEEFESEATKPDAQDMTAGGKVCCVLVLLTSGHRYLFVHVYRNSRAHKNGWLE